MSTYTDVWDMYQNVSTQQIVNALPTVAREDSETKNALIDLLNQRYARYCINQSRSAEVTRSFGDWLNL